jgi:hypothetical protein
MNKRFKLLVFFTLQNEIFFLLAEKAGSRTSSRAGGSTDGKDKQKVPSRPPSVTEQIFEDGVDDPKSSWTLDHVTEIVYLATQVQMTEQIEAALMQMEEGKDDALKVCFWYFIEPSVCLCFSRF